MRLTDDTARDVLATATPLTAEDAVAQFLGGAAAARAVAVPATPSGRGHRATLAAVTELAPMKVTTRLLELADAVGGFQPSGRRDGRHP